MSFTVKGSKVHTTKRTFTLTLALALVIGFSVSIGAFYLPNAGKPMFLARDLGEDVAYFFSSIPSTFRRLFGLTTPVMDAESAVKDNTIQTQIAPVDPYAAERQTAGSIVTTIIGEIPNANKEYVSYASQHGVDPKQSWTVELILVSSDGKAVLGELWIQYDGTVQVISAYSKEPNILNPYYHVVLDLNAAQAFMRDYYNMDFLKASRDFVAYLCSGELVWW